MKKTLSMMLIGTMLLMPTPVFATEDDNDLHSLRFDKIEEEMEARSPLIINSVDKVADASSDINSLISQLKTAKESMETNPYKPLGYISGMTLKEVPLPTVPQPTVGEDFKTNDQGMINYLNDQLNYISLYNYVSQVSSLQTQIESLEDKRGDMWKSWLQVEQGKEQAIWGAQQLYLAYNGIAQTKDNLQTNVTLLQKKLTAQQLKESLGLAIHTDVTATELQIKELNMTLDKLNQSMDDLKGQLNVMLGQDFDTELTLSEPSSVSQSKLRAMDYEEDLDDALIQSYNVRLKEDSDEIKDAERSFTLAFHQAYQNVQDKKKALELEQLKLNNEQLKYDQNVLMNSLGLISSLDFEGLRSLYLTQVNKVKTAQQDVLQAYTSYDWMKKGLTVSNGASASVSAGSTSAQ